MTAAPTSPYKGLSAFEDSELDALLFFGREREREIVVANLIASRLTVLYGPSGVGKSSLLRGGSCTIAARASRGPARRRVLELERRSERRGSPRRCARPQGSHRTVGPGRSHGCTGGARRLPRPRSGGGVLPVPRRRQWAALVRRGAPALLGTPRASTSWSPCARTPSRSSTASPAGSRACSRTHCGSTGSIASAARAAIIGPVERYAALAGSAVAVEPALIDAVLDEVGAGQIELALGGLGTVDGEPVATRIEAPYLQLVMQRLWEEERAAGSSVCARRRSRGWAALGTSSRSTSTVPWPSCLRSRRRSRPASSTTSSRLRGRRSPTRSRTSPTSAGVPSARSSRCCATLSAAGSCARSTRVVSRYEIFHDVLAQPVLAWRVGYEAEREVEGQQEASDRRHRQLLAIIAAGASCSP